MKRRLADKLLDALETAWEQGRGEVAKRLDLIYQSLIDENSVVHDRRLSDGDEEFDAENSESFRRDNIYKVEEPKPQNEDSEDGVESNSLRREPEG